MKILSLYRKKKLLIVLCRKRWRRQQILRQLAFAIHQGLKPHIKTVLLRTRHHSQRVINMHRLGLPNTVYAV